MHVQLYMLYALAWLFTVSARTIFNQEISFNDLFNTHLNKSGTVVGGNIFQHVTPTNPPVPGPEGATCGINSKCVQHSLCITKIDPRTNNCLDTETCCDYSNMMTQPINPTKAPETHVGCGYRNSNGIGFKIVNTIDEESEFGEFPWMAIIFHEEKTDGEVLKFYKCGGSIIAPNVVITAAQCVQTRRAEELIVRGGEWDTRTTTEIRPHQDRRVSEIVVHEEFNKASMFNDIAILILESPLVWDENVRPICLPEIGRQDENKRCVATGWGSSENHGILQAILKKIDLPLVNHEVCERKMRTIRQGLDFTLHESIMCAGGEKGKDTCKGDGGSPLSCTMPNDPDRHYLSGIVSWGIGCGKENLPGAYAKVSYLRPWLDEKLRARNIDFSYFTAN